MPLSAVLLLIAVVVVWGGNWPTLKLAIEHMQPLWFAALRLALGAATLFAVLAWRGQLAMPRRADWPVVASVGLLQMAAFSALINLGLQVVPAGRSAILAYTTPLWVAPGAALLLGERLTLARIAGVGLGLAGIAVMFNPLAVDWNDGRAMRGNGLLLLGALAWAASILHVRGHDWKETALEAVPWQMLVGLAVLLPLAWSLEGPPKGDTSPQFLAIAFYNGPIATAFAVWAVIRITKRLPAVTVSLGLLAVPAAGVVASALVLGEPLTASNLAGLTLIGAGVTTVAVSDARRGAKA